MGFGGGMKPPSPEEMKAMAERMQGGGGPGGLPNLPKDLPAGLRQRPPEFAGLTGLSGKPTLAGSRRLPGKKRNEDTVIASEAKQSMPPLAEEWIASSQVLLAMTN